MRPISNYERIVNRVLLLFAVFCALAPIVFKMGWLQ